MQGIFRTECEEMDIVLIDRSLRNSVAKRMEKKAIHGGQHVVQGVFFRIFEH